MLKSFTIVAALLAGTALCVAQDKPDEPLPGATSINLQLEGASPEEAFAELAKQANVQIKPMGGMGQNLWAKADPVELKVENGRFWPVFIDMCQQANVKFNPMYYGGGEPRTVQLFGPDQGMDSFTKMPHVEVQGCVIALTHASRNYQITFGSQNQTHTSFGLQGAFMPDPGVTFSSPVQAVVTEAVDENGTSLAPPRNDGARYGGGGPSMMQHLFIQLAYPPNTGKKLVRLKGEIKTSVVTKSETLSVDLPLETPMPPKDLTNLSIEVKSVKQVGNGVEVQVIMRSKRPMQGREQPDMYGLVSSIDLVDDKGNHFANRGIRSASGSPTGLDITAQFFPSGPSQAGKPTKLTWVLPVETKDVRLPFEFKDLPIP